MYPGMGFMPPRPGPGGLPGLPAGFPGCRRQVKGRGFFGGFWGVLEGFR